jgi:hypothetical protein
MRRIVLVSVLALLVTGASAQGRGGGVRGGVHGGIAFRPAFSGGHGYGQIPGGHGYGHLPDGSGHRPYGYGYLGGGYGYGYAGDDYVPYDAGGGYTYPPQPVFVMSPPPPPPVIQPPARPVLTNYTWPATSEHSPAVAPGAEAQTFGIVLKDGSTLAATAVVASDDVLHIVDPDERHMRVSMSAVDRAATLKLNRERKLDLYLPASQR